MPQFLGLRVLRRTLRPDGTTVIQDWAELDLKSTVAQIMTLAIEEEEEDISLQKVLFPGLYMTRPRLARRTPYPDENNLEQIKKTLTALEQAGGGDKKILSPLEHKLDKGEFNPFAGGQNDPGQGPVRSPAIRATKRWATTGLSPNTA